MRNARELQFVYYLIPIVSAFFAACDELSRRLSTAAARASADCVERADACAFRRRLCARAPIASANSQRKHLGQRANRKQQLDEFA